MTGRRLRILLVDDHPVVREGYRRLLERQPDLEVVGEAADGVEAYRRFKDLSPDVVVMDLAMPGRGGIDVIRQMRQRAPDAKILVFSMHQDTVFAVKAIEAGARGYITKSRPPETLVAGIREVAAGRLFLGPDTAEALALDGLTDRRSLVGDLAPREFEIMRMLAEGRTIAEIAASLAISPKTVANYHSQIKSKLGVRTDIELLRLAFRARIVEIGTG